jgi:N-acetylglucosamine-6-sulfatase
VPRRFLTAVLAALLLAACTPASRPAATPSPSAGRAATGASAARPNIVFVLTDDLAWNLVRYMPHVQELQRAGTTFANYTVTDSLCCPSRASIFSGKFPHDTGVYTNNAPDGGYGVFSGRGEEKSTFATDLQSAGYHTALMGKYLNGYLPESRVVPAGWTEWDVAGNAYREFRYRLLENGRLKYYGNRPADYLTDVVSTKAQRFIAASAAARQPFLVEVATFAPHAPFTPAPRDENSFLTVRAPRSAAYNRLPSAAPPWLATRRPLTRRQKDEIDVEFRLRVQAVQAVDRMLAALRTTLTRAGVARNTVVVFTSDNGFHMGEHRLNPGKQTAFDTDVRVPLVMAGPGIRDGATVTQPAENVDLRPTFGDLAGVATPGDVDGRSLHPLLAGAAPVGWRSTALIEHHGPDTRPGDPDYPAPFSGNPPTFSAIRTTRYTYVEYTGGVTEYYDHAADPYQVHNIAAQLPAATREQLHRQLTALTACHGAAACWSAAH